MYRGRDGLNAIAPQWAAVSAGLLATRFYQYYEWFQSYLETLEPCPDAVRFFVAYRADAPVAIIPLRIARLRIGAIVIRLLESPGDPHMPLFDILCREDVSCRAVLGELVRFLRTHARLKWDALRFRNIPEDSRLLGAPVPGGALAHREVTGACDFFECRDDYDGISARFSKNFRANLRKARNRLIEHPDVAFQCVTDRDELPAALREFVAIEASGWKGTGGTATAIELRPELVAFYRALTVRFSAIGKCRINLLVLNGQTIGAEFCLLDDDTLYLLKIAHDESHAHLSPGNLLLEWVLQNVEAEPAIRFVSLVTDSAWHADWKPRSHRICKLTMCNRTLRGLALNGYLRTRQLLRRMRHRRFAGR